MAKVENAAGRIAPEFFEEYALYKPFEFWETIQASAPSAITGAVRIRMVGYRLEQAKQAESQEAAK